MNMINGMMFGGEGPIMQGTWYNPRTGDAFTVRDSFFEDNQYVVSTTDGRFIKYDQLQNYIQSDMPLNQLKQMGKEVKENQKEEIPADIMNLIATDNDPESGMLLPEDMELLRQPAKLGNINDASRHIAPASMHTTSTTKPANDTTDMNTIIIDKALRNASKPSFKVNIDWTSYPEKEIEMLKDIMGISKDDIVAWYLSQIQLDDVVKMMSNEIIKRIIGDLVIEDPVVSPAIGMEELQKLSATPVKKSPKKTTKKTITKN